MSATWLAIKYDVFPFALVYPLERMDGAHYVVAGLGHYRSSGILGTMDEDTALDLRGELDALRESMRTHNDALIAQAKQAVARAIGKKV